LEEILSLVQFGQQLLLMVLQPTEAPGGGRQDEPVADQGHKDNGRSNSDQSFTF